jgi:hypothetical protein
MPVKTLFIHGPSASGKAVLARLVAEHVLERPVHLLRLEAASDGYTNTLEPFDPRDASARAVPWSSAHRVAYTAERVFETIPDALRAVRELDRRAFVLIEADDAPALRHAWPYDYRIFVMPAPESVFEVFRDQQAATEALREVMHDTAAFASEIFGLFDAHNLEDAQDVRQERRESTDPTGRRQRIDEVQVGGSHVHHFLRTPLGAEVASRIQLQPAYHGLVEADVVVISAPRRHSKPVVVECTQRIEKLLKRIRHDARRRSVLYWGDLNDCGDPIRRKLFRRLKLLMET